MIKQELRPDGVAVLTWDLEGHAANVLSTDSIERFAELARQVIADPKVIGVVVASAKRDFLAGADLTKILPGTMSREEYAAQIRRFHGHWRAIETGGKPFVAALNGSTLGGGLELALACHRRIAADNPATRIGLPEVTLALIPGGGGTQRLPRLIGLDKALPLIVEGKTVSVAEAARLGIVEDVVPAEELLERACVWAREAGAEGAVQRWQVEGAQPAETAPIFAAVEAAMMARTRGLQNAPRRALDAVREGAGLPMDEALAVETRHFVDSCFDPQAINTIRTNFFGVASARKLASRPAGVPARSFARIGVLGAGMMGAGIAQVSAEAGMDVVMLDASVEQAARGHGKVKANLDKQVARGRLDQARADKTLARILPTGNVADLADADIIIEAVFENRDVKADVTRRTTAVIRPDIVFASNTSTLPITGLAEASPRPDLFIGMHFFSPVERMALVEVILGDKTSDFALAHALDFIKALRKVPIVVRDGRGFYTSRVFATYIYEALEMLEEGVSPDLVEEGGLLAGFPMSPLALSDQLSIELAYKVQSQERVDLGDAFQETAAYRVCRLMVETLGRKGKAAGAGYYDYAASGERALWPGLRDQFKPLASQPTAAEVATRILAIQSVETLRCFEEGIVSRPIEADVGAVLGWGYPAFRGGPVGHVDTLGPKEFLALCDRLAGRYGSRYALPAGQRARLERGERYYGPTPASI